MNLIPILGLLPYLYYMIQNRSNILGIICFNGFLFHYNDKNKILKYYDISVNSIFVLYNIYYLEFTYYCLVGILSFCLNMLCIYKYNTKQIGDIIHVVFVQWMLLKHIIIVFKY